MKNSNLAVPGRQAVWPRPVWVAFESILILFANAYLAARSRAAGSPSKIVRLLAEISDLKWRNALLERELAAQRCRLASMDPARRPHFLPENRIQLLLLIHLWGWSVKQAAQRLVLHRNTLTDWRRRLLVCDHGCQFRTWFRERLEHRLGVTPVSGKVRSPTFNGKAERFFRTLKGWVTGLVIAHFADKTRTARWLQRRLDVFRGWYNEVRVHQGLGGRTPEEVWSGAPAVEPCHVGVRDPQPEITVRQRSFRGNHRLPVFEIDVRWPEAA